MSRPAPVLPPRRRGFRRALGFGGGAICVLALGCEDVVVRTADVRAVLVEPPETQVAVDGNVQLSARATDATGAAVTGLTISWTSEEPGVAEVDEDGVVTGRALGTATIRASVGGHAGAATVSVLRAGTIAFEAESLALSAIAGMGDPQPVDVAITNAGDLPLTGLRTSVEYDSPAEGWLSAALAATTAPTTLTVTIRLQGLAAGTHNARIVVAAAAEEVRPSELPVVVDVEEPRTTAPGDLDATAVSGEAEVRLTWTDRADNEAGFRVERKGPGEAQFTAVGSPGPDEEAYTDSDVEPDGTYIYRVGACVAGDCSAVSNEASATTHPHPPSELEAGALSPTSIRITWTDNSATEAGFRVERRSGGEYAQVATTGIDQTAFTDDELTPATEYTYRVRSCNGGGCSAYASEVAATTRSLPAPDAPTGLEARYDADAGRIELTWEDNSGDEASFRVRRAVGAGEFAARATLDANTVRFTDADVEDDRVYRYQVLACGAADQCSAPSDEASLTTPPSAPAGLQATGVSSSAVDLAWDDRSATETGFELARGVDGGGFSALASLPAGTTAHRDGDVAADHAYRYRVRACNGTGCSDWSNALTVTTPPGTPQGVSATALSSTSVRVGWTDVGTESRYDVQVEGAGETRVEEVGADAETHTVGGLRVSTAYRFRVRACNGSGCGPYSAPVEATTLGIAAPSDLAAAPAEGGRRIDLSWKDNAADETRYEVQRGTGSAFQPLAGQLPPGTTSYSDADVGSDATYSYRVRACNTGGCSAFSETASASTAPGAPDGLAVAEVTVSAVVLTWNDRSSTEEAFRVERRVRGGDFEVAGAAPRNASGFVDEDARADSVYEYRVRACNDSGCSDASDPVEAATPPAAPAGVLALVLNREQVRVSWQDASSTETRYVVERSVNGNAYAVREELGANTTTYMDRVDVHFGAVLRYRITACNESLCGRSATSNAVLAP